jgi:flagellar biosynthesis GTPase FlhF
MDPPPPPPPPHGANQQSGRPGGLPDGKYDIFVIPPHSAGSGFLYLPSLSTHRNSFLAGALCTAFAFFVYSVAVPVVKEFFQGIMAGNSSGVMVLMIGVGVLCWAWGKTQAEGVNRPRPGPTGSSSGGSTAGGAFDGHAGGPQSTGSAQPNPSAQPNASAPPPGGAGPKSSWQRPNPQATGGAGANASAKTSWEKAREETRKKEEERRRAEEAKKRREEAEKERQKQREKDAREKEARERREKREKEQKEKEEREKEEKERAEKEKERQKAASEPTKDRSPPKRPPNPTVRTENEDDAYSFRPYDRPKKPVHKANSAASMYSESSYAPSQSTARTTPPPVHRGPYTTKDPDKIIIKGVYSFNNAFMRTPIAQLISGSGNVTDGLILRITTEGLFIDDDVRGVPQREWDIKAWTMKLAEVWCPSFLECSTSTRSPRRNASQSYGPVQSVGETDAFLKKLSQACNTHCYETPCSENKSSCASRRTYSTTSASCSTAYSSTSSGTDDTVTQSGEMIGLHVLRASIRDQEGKKYVFVLSQSEGWKVAIGLQRLRRGTQVRALGVSGLPPNETKALIENLGWA